MEKLKGKKLLEKDKNKNSIGILSVVFAFLFPIVGLILGIVGVCRNEKHSVYGIVLSILMPIFYLLLWGNVLKPKIETPDYDYAPSYEYYIDDDYDLDDYDLDLEDN